MNPSGRSPKMSVVSKSLRSLTKKERPCAIRSGRSEEMSDRERIAQVAHFFSANRSFAHFWAKNERFAQKSNEQIPSPAIFTKRGSGQKEQNPTHKRRKNSEAKAKVVASVWAR